MRLENIEVKIEVMKEKERLRERGEWITDDLTDRERKIEWLIRRGVEKKRREKKRARAGYMKMWVEIELWIWDEEKEGLRKWNEEKEGRGER